MSRKFEIIDRKEKERISHLWETLYSGEKIFPTEVFGSKAIPRILEDTPLAYWNSFSDANPMLPLDCLLFSKTIVMICPKCDCSINPELLKPYLERELIVPLLTHRLSDYRDDFSELIIQYPYVSFDTHSFVKIIDLFKRCPSETAHCEHCFDKITEQIKRKLLEIPKGEEFVNMLDDAVFPNLYPDFQLEAHILTEIREAVEQKNLALLKPLGAKSELLETLRYAQAFGAIPQTNQEVLVDIIKILERIGISMDREFLEEIRNRELTASALNLDYNPKISVDDYLDIITPRRKKINSLVRELILSGKGDLSSINDEIWSINKEISSSKTIETLTFLTDFVFSSAPILFGIFAGALLGYSSISLAGCGLGGLLGGIVGKLSKRKSLKIPRYPKKTSEWIKAKIESPQEKLLSIMLSKDIKVIQIWNLRRKLKE